MQNSKVIPFLKVISKPFKVHLSVFTVAAILQAVEVVLQPFIVKLLIDQVNDIASRKSPIVSIAKPIVCYLSVASVMAISSGIHEWVHSRFIANFKKKIGSYLMAYLLHKPYAFYQGQFSGALASKVNDCISTIPRLIRTFYDDFFSDTLALLISIYTLWQVSPCFAIALIIWVTMYLFACIKLAPKVRQTTNKVFSESSKGMGHINDIITNIVNVKLFAKEVNEYKFVKSNFERWANVYGKHAKILVGLYIAQLSTFVLLQGVCLFWLCQGLTRGRITAGDFALIFMINISINRCLFGLSRTIADFNESIGTLTHSLQIIEQPNEPNTILDTVYAKSLRVIAGKITFDHVYFNYKGAPLLFEDMCVTIEAGQKVGLVGASGGGKSTFVNLILRFYEPTKGRILIDNQDIKEVSLSSLRTQIAIIPQDPYLFHRTLKENIQYGRLDANYETVVQAAKQAYAHEFIVKLPQQYNTLVGERGTKISGGQSQRIAIARGILKDAPIMILDEATSQLDSITENYIQEALWNVIKGKTTIVIAHRLSTLLHMDRILVFEKGKIVEDGSHSELIAKKGVYKSLWDAQVGGFLSDTDLY
ncbi:MAG: ABC transporter ATP-binding protein [Candidatus Amoebophilus sp.]